MRLGLLAAARITGPAVVEPALLIDDVELAAVAARSIDRAREAARTWDVTTAYGSYEELLADTTLDAVYIASPAALHRRWTVAAFEAGLDVLCEKPIAANADDARAMVEAASRHDRILTEAFHWRYHPFAQQVHDLVFSGRIGTVTRVEGRFLVPEGHIPETDIRWDLALGGGALMDLGCYPAQWVRWIAGGEPTVVTARATCPVPAIDTELTAELRWPSGVTGSIECSMTSRERVADLVVIGTEGTIVADGIIAPQHGAELTVTGGDGRTESVDVQSRGTTTYYHQLIAFRDAVVSRQPTPTGGADAIATMELIDACYRAAGLEPRPTHPD